tara:strand:- start:327 stop:1397 length:1071 start_codon:yes stop_codon:yes gene_type:complete
MFQYFLLFFFINTFIIFIVTKFNTKNLFLDRVDKKHAIHDFKVFKLGGLLVFLNLILFIFLEFYTLPSNLFNFFIFSLAVSSIGIFEDYKSTDKFTWRLFLILIISTYFVISNNFFINNLNLGLNLIDNLYNSNNYIKILVTIFCINTVIHSFNFIDGVNGNLNIYILSILTSIFIVLNLEKMFVFEFKIIFEILLYLVISLFFFNYPKPLIFMGDGGAYFFGALVSSFVILLSINISYDKISIWYYANLMIFPFTEMFISFFRRIFFNKKKPTSADKKHLHHLVLKIFENKLFFVNKSKNILNSSVALIILIIYFPTILFSTFFYNDEIILKYIFYTSFIFFILIYNFLRNFKND